MLQYRAELDAVVTLVGGGSLTCRALHVDVPHADVTHPEIAMLLVAALGLRDVDRVDLDEVRVFAEPAVTVGVRSAVRMRYVELGHVIQGAEFGVDRGTYLESPRHRHEDGADLAGIPLERLADLPSVVVRTIDSGRRAIEAADLESLTVAGHAVLLHTGGDRSFGTPGYGVYASYLTADAAKLLVERGAALVGIDAADVDDASPAGAAERPAHTVLVAAGIPVVAHLTGLAELPPTGARFTAAPPRIAGFGTFPVRAYATMPYFEPHDHTRSAGWLPTTTQQ